MLDDLLKENRHRKRFKNKKRESLKRFLFFQAYLIKITFELSRQLLFVLLDLGNLR